MTPDDEDAAVRSDPMGVRRRWGRRELIFLAVAAVVLIVVAWLASQGYLGGTPRGAPIGAVPGVQDRPARTQ